MRVLFEITRFIMMMVSGFVADDVSENEPKWWKRMLLWQATSTWCVIIGNLLLGMVFPKYRDKL